MTQLTNICNGILSREVRIRGLAKSYQALIKSNIVHGFERTIFRKRGDDYRTVAFDTNYAVIGGITGADTDRNSYITCWDLAHKRYKWRYEPTSHVGSWAKLFITGSEKVVCMSYDPSEIYILSLKDGVQETQINAPLRNSIYSIAIVADAIFILSRTVTSINAILIDLVGYNLNGRIVCSFEIDDAIKLIATANGQLFIQGKECVRFGDARELTSLSSFNEITIRKMPHKKFFFDVDRIIYARICPEGIAVGGCEKKEYKTTGIDEDYYRRYLKNTELTVITAQKNWVYVGNGKGVLIAINPFAKKDIILDKHPGRVSWLFTGDDILVSICRTTISYSDRERASYFGEIMVWNLNDHTLLKKIELDSFRNVVYRNGKLCIATRDSLKVFDFNVWSQSENRVEIL